MVIVRRRTVYGLWLLVAVLIAAVYYPTLRWLALNWVGNPYYRIGILVPIISAYLAWRLQRGRALEATPGGWSLGLGLLAIGAALAIHALALSQQALLLSSATLVLALAGTVLALAGWSTLERQAFPLAFLFLALPFSWLQTCNPALSQWVAQGAAALGRVFRVPVTASGANLTLPSVALEVASPCTGVGSLTAFVALAAVYAFAAQGPLLGKVALVVLAAPTALLASLARTSALVGLTHYVSVEFALRYDRIWSALLLFLVGIAFFGLIARALGCDDFRPDI